MAPVTAVLDQKGDLDDGDGWGDFGDDEVQEAPVASNSNAATIL